MILTWIRYVIDLSQARFQPFEAQMCRELLQKIPLFFVLNKVRGFLVGMCFVFLEFSQADTADRSQTAAVRQLVEGLQLENCKGVFAVVSDRKNYNMVSRNLIQYL